MKLQQLLDRLRQFDGSKLRQPLDTLGRLNGGELRQSLEKLPHQAFGFAGAAVVGLIALTVALASGGGTSDVRPPSVVPLSEFQPTPALAAVAPTPTATAQPNRSNCDQIRGTAYQSDAEQEWFRSNCGGASEQQASSAPAREGGTTAQVAAAPRPPASSGVQIATGSRLVIPAANVDTQIFGTAVSASAGTLPDPTCYFCALEYDLSAFGLGNRKVLAGHVDCARCNNGSPGLAVFWYLRNLGAGDRITYYSGGQAHTFAVTAVVAYGPDVDVISLARNADMTLITCGGTWNAAAHEYSTRTFVFANLVG